MHYISAIDSKDNVQVPLFENLKPMFSKYRSLSDGERFADENKNSRYLITGGIGNPIHIKSFLDKNPSALVIAFEEDKKDLDFSFSFPLTKELLKKENVIFICLDKLKETIKNTYIPSFYSSLSFVSLRSWQENHREAEKKAFEKINEVLEDIKADYSVQSHFGKQWQRNIILNTENIFSKIKIDEIPLDNTKTACIIAAGPSLDKTYNQLIENREKITIFATDTAFSSLEKRGIKSDFVVSIDCQNVSLSHFYSLKKNTEKKGTFFVLDSASPHTIFTHVHSKGYSSIQFASYHPLSQKIAEETGLFTINEGSGTVTIAALDLAILLGYKKIRFYGADFSYNMGKAYTKGTYLEKNFAIKSSRLKNEETSYTRLMFRTELKEKKEESIFSGTLENSKTSVLLSSYEKSTLDFLKKEGFIKEKDFFIKKTNGTFNKSLLLTLPAFNTDNKDAILFRKSFVESLIKETEGKIYTENSFPNKEQKIFLPYISWERKFFSEKEADFPLVKLFEKAREKLLQYRF